MKKLQRKRFLALIMALTMVFSSSVVASAAEKEENNSMVTVETLTEKNASTTMSTMSTNAIYQSSVYSGSTAKVYNFSINITDPMHLYLHAAADTGVTATLYKDGVQIGRAVYMEKDGVGASIPVVKTGSNDNYWTEGNYTMKVKISFNKPYTFFIYGY